MTKAAKVRQIAICGAGALGSHFALLARNLDAELVLIDFDRVEQKNLLSQFSGRQGVGKLKVQALAQLLDFLFQKKAQQVSSRITADNARQLFDGRALVVDCLDNATSRRVVQAACRDLRAPLVHGALAADGGFGRAVWDEYFVVDEEAGAGAPTCEGGEHLPFAALTAAYLTRAAQIFLSTGRRVGFEISPAGAIAT